jgi:hypothetical protein
MEELEKPMYFGARPNIMNAELFYISDFRIRMFFILTLKSPPGDLGVAFSWQNWRTATRNPVEVLRYE